MTPRHHRRHRICLTP